MPTLQIIVIAFWSIIYSIISYISITDLIKDRFIIKNDTINTLTAIWKAATLAGLVWISIVAFAQ